MTSATFTIKTRKLNERGVLGITIPKDVRDILSLKTGNIVMINIEIIAKQSKKKNKKGEQRG